MKKKDVPILRGTGETSPDRKFDDDYLTMCVRALYMVAVDEFDPLPAGNATTYLELYERLSITLAQGSTCTHFAVSYSFMTFPTRASCE